MISPHTPPGTKVALTKAVGGFPAGVVHTLLAIETVSGNRICAVCESPLVAILDGVVEGVAFSLCVLRRVTDISDLQKLLNTAPTDADRVNA